MFSKLVFQPLKTKQSLLLEILFLAKNAKPISTFTAL